MVHLPNIRTVLLRDIKWQENSFRSLEDMTAAETSLVTQGQFLRLGEFYRLDSGKARAIHFSLSDELDGVKDPYLIKSSGAFKNADCYSALQVMLTYSISPKCRTCNKDD